MVRSVDPKILISNELRVHVQVPQYKRGGDWGGGAGEGGGGRKFWGMISLLSYNMSFSIYYKEKKDSCFPLVSYPDLSSTLQKERGFW